MTLENDKWYWIRDEERECWFPLYLNPIGEWKITIYAEKIFVSWETVKSIFGEETSVARPVDFKEDRAAERDSGRELLLDYYVIGDEETGSLQIVLQNDFATVMEDSAMVKTFTSGFYIEFNEYI